MFIVEAVEGGLRSFPTLYIREGGMNEYNNNWMIEGLHTCGL